MTKHFIYRFFLVLLLVVFLFGCSSEKKGRDSSDNKIKISLSNPNNEEIYSVYMKLDYGDAKVEGIKKSLTISGNRKGETKWDRIKRKGPFTTEEDELWWEYSKDGILRLSVQGSPIVNDVYFSFDDESWQNVNSADYAVYVPSSSKKSRNVFSVIFDLTNRGFLKGEHFIKIKYTGSEGTKEIPDEIFRWFSSEGIKFTVGKIAGAASNFTLMLNDSFFDTSVNKSFMKIGLTAYVPFKGAGDIIEIPVKIKGDKNNITIKNFSANNKKGAAFPEIKATLKVDRLLRN